MGLYSKPSSIKLISDEKEKLLADKKAELELHKDEMADLIRETKALTMSIVERFKKESAHVRSALKATLNNKYDKGVIFLSHRGEVLFVNKPVVDNFGVPLSKLSGTCVDHVLIGKSKRDISECSKHLIETIKTDAELAEKSLETVGTCFGKKKTDACTLVLENGETLGPFFGEMALLDPKPSALVDITYIIYLESSKKEAVIS